MAQVVENYAEVTGKVESIEPGDVPDHQSVRLYVDTVAPVPGFRNLMEHAAGHAITVQVPAAAAPQVGDSPVRLRVRVAGPNRYFAGT